MPVSPRPSPRAPLSRLLVGLLWVVPVVFFGYFTLVERWVEADRALAYLGAGPRIVVGVSVQASASGPSADAHRGQIYLVLPASLRTLNAYAVFDDGGRVRVAAIRFGLLIFGGIYFAWIGGSIWYLLRRMHS